MKDISGVKSIIPRKIFKSKMNLNFFDENMERLWFSYVEPKRFSLILGSFGILLLLLSNLIMFLVKTKAEFQCKWNMPVVTQLAIAILINLIISITLIVRKANEVLFMNIVHGTIFVSLGVYFNLLLLIMSIEGEVMHFSTDSVVIIFFLLNLTQRVYTFLFVKGRNFTLGLSVLVNCSYEIIFSVFILEGQSIWYPISRCVFLLIVYGSKFINEVKDKINFYSSVIGKDMSNSICNTKACPMYDLKASIFSVDCKQGRIDYMNKACMSLISKWSGVQIKERSIVTEGSYTMEHVPDYYMSYLRNSLFYIKNRNDHQDSAGDVTITYGEDETRAVENILVNITQVNQKLPENLYNFLIGINTNEGNMNSNFGSNLTLSPLKYERTFPFSQLITTIQQTQNKNYNKSTYNDNTNENVHLMLDNNNSTQGGSSINLRHDLDSYTYIGKIVLGGIGSQCELFVSLYYNREHGKINFLLENMTTILMKERQETAATCRSLYLSKISHEFRNPICNILEILNFISEDINCKEYHDDALTEENGFTAKDAMQRMNSNVELLKNVCDIMLYTVKDLTFYSTVDMNSDIQSAPKFLNAMISSTYNIKEIVREVVHIFNLKSITDNKDQRLKILMNGFKGDLTVLASRENEKEMFCSLIFNLILTAYKSANTGTIFVNISQSSSRVSFEVKILGVLKQKFTSNEEHNPKKDDDLSEDSSVDSKEEEQRKPSINLSVINKEQQQSTNLLMPRDFNMCNIFNINDLTVRNQIVEEFNNNFSAYVSKVYSKYLGIDLTIESTNEYSRYYFSKDFKIVENEIKTHRNTSPVQHLTNTLDLFRQNFHKNTLSRKKSSYELCTLRKLPAPKKRNSSMLNKSVDSTAKTIIYSKGLFYDYSSSDADDSQEDDIGVSVGICNKTHRTDNIDMLITYQMKKVKIVSPEKRQGAQRFRRPTLNHSSHNLRNNNLKCISQRGVKRTSEKIVINDREIVRVLLTDDESLVRRGLHRYFNQISKEESIIFDIQHADNGFECLNSVYNYHQEGKSFNILIIDENMPYIKGSQIVNLLSGIFAMGELKRFKLISYTSYDSIEKKSFILSQGANFVLNKPIKYSEFKAFFMKHLYNN